MSGQVIRLPYCAPPAQFQWNAPYASMPGCQPCPPYPPPCGGPAPIFGPIVGVIDGSDAAPGMVGEFIAGSANVAYTAYPNTTTTTVSLMVVPPGDWDLWMQMGSSSVLGAFEAYLNPLPAGMNQSMQMSMYIGATGSTTVEGINLYSVGRGSFSVPTLMPVAVDVWQTTDASLPAGTLYLAMYGRRRR